MTEFLAGVSVGATVAIVADYLVQKYLTNIATKIKADIKADLADSEALKKSAEAEVARLKQDAEKITNVPAEVVKVLRAQP